VKLAAFSRKKKGASDRDADRDHKKGDDGDDDNGGSGGSWRDMAADVQKAHNPTSSLYANGFVYDQLEDGLDHCSKRRRARR
jgi:hypothetical protein